LLAGAGRLTGKDLDDLFVTTPFSRFREGCAAAR
jgi:hypothetical protein